MKKGITLIMLTITMVILLILLSTVTITGFNTYNNNQKLSFATEINMIQMMVDTYKTKNDGIYPTNAEFELNIAGVTESAKVQFANETMTNNKINLKKIDYDKLGVSSLKYGNGSGGEVDSYLVSEKTGIVYYAKGVKIGSNTYYTLTDELKTMVSVISPNSTVDNESGITFTVSETEFTSDKVETVVRIPVRYTGVTVSYLDTDLVESGTLTYTSQGDYKVVTVNELVNNYILTIKYTDGDSQKTTTYAVSNVDKNAPSLSIDNVKEKIVESSDGKKIYLSLENITDDKSGLKQIKYAEKYIGESEESRASSDEIADYFKNGGTIVKNNVINLYSPTKYVTIYAEDNVGNFAAIYYKLSDEMLEELTKNENGGIVTSAMIKADPESFYGKTVTGYTADSSSIDKEWQIFYSDGSHIYLISKNYLTPNNEDGVVDNDEVPNMPNGETVGEKSAYSSYINGVSLSNAVNFYAGAAEITSSNPAYTSLSYVRAYPTNSNDNMKAVAYMTDQEVWTVYIGKDADYALAGPTIEQFASSYNSVSHSGSNSRVYWKIDGAGYKLSSDNSNFVNDLTSFITSDYNNLYLASNASAVAWKIASPSSFDSSRIIHIDVNGNISSGGATFTASGFRPIICLKSGITLEKNGDGFIIK